MKARQIATLVNLVGAGLNLIVVWHRVFVLGYFPVLNGIAVCCCIVAGLGIIILGRNEE